MRHLDLFSGIGGFALAARWVGWETVGFCEIDPYCQKVLRKHWPDVPVYEDIRELSGGQVGPIDIITGGFPCQDISYAGKGAGIEGERSGLWSELARLIGDIRPRYAVLENVAALLSGDSGRWFQRVLGDLAEVGYDCEWHCIPASAIGAPHKRDRVWIVANADKPRLEGRLREIMCERSREWATRQSGDPRNGHWLAEPNVGRVANGIPRRVDRLKGLGNAIVPQVAEIIFRAINDQYPQKPR